MLNQTNQEELLDARIDAILNRIESLKSIIAGRNTSFKQYTHELEENELQFSNMQTSELIKKLLKHIGAFYTSREISLSTKQKEFYRLFFKLAINFLIVNCNEEDWIFESIIKISGTIDKNKSSDTSIFDVMIEDYRQLYPLDYVDFHTFYNQFNVLYDENAYDVDYFKPAVKDAINCHLDDLGISYYNNLEYFNNTIKLLDNTAKSLITLRYEKNE